VSQADPKTTTPANARIRARLEVRVEKLIAALDALDPHYHGYGTTSEDDEPDDTGIADQDGLTEQTVGEHPMRGAVDRSSTSPWTR
jgi:hypothetical protein